MNHSCICKSDSLTSILLFRLVFLALIGSLIVCAQAAVPRMHQLITSYEGAETCSMCHSKAASEVMDTTHWTWHHEDPESGQVLGKRNVINNYCISVASNEPRCTSCHVGVGYSDQNFDFTDATKVDCLVCHDTTGTYQKFPTGAGHPVTEPKEFPPGSGKMWLPPDLTMIAQNAGSTRRATCGACHFKGGGGDAVKHGDMDTSLLHPDRLLDVHMAEDGMNFQCSNCHRTEDHQIPGTRYPSAVTDDQMCQSCHSDAPHEHERLDAHTARLACQTCHIPEYARGGKATKMFWDWTTAGQKNEDGSAIVTKDENGNPTYDTKKGSFIWEENVVPEYVWFNGGVTYVTLDDAVSEGQLVSINKLHGTIEDPNARIFPVKRFTGIQPFDAGAGTLAQPHLFGSDANAYWKSYDWELSLQAGMAAVGREFQGPVGYVETEMFWIQNHMVAPKEDALSCIDCHGDQGRLDFVALGYGEDRAKALLHMSQTSSFRLTGITFLEGVNQIEIAWEVSSGNQYQVQYSDDLSDWKNADDGLLEAEDGQQSMQWSDSITDRSQRFYRIISTHD